MNQFVFTALLTLSSHAYAFDEAPLDAHVHGLVDMTLVAENHLVEVQITSPLMNLVGFEYEARTETEKKALHDMAEAFEAPLNWLQFGDAHCQLVGHSVSHAGDNHDSHEHQEHHEHEHEHEHEQHNSEHAQHAELEANYQFKCDSDNLKSVSISLQEQFAGIESISLSWIVNTASGIATLDHNKNSVDFTH